MPAASAGGVAFVPVGISEAAGPFEAAGASAGCAVSVPAASAEGAASVPAGASVAVGISEVAGTFAEARVSAGRVASWPLPRVLAFVRGDMGLLRRWGRGPAVGEGRGGPRRSVGRPGALGRRVGQ
ncbi:hypothetical protein [Streptomyces althioticus]|uniref:hypothetical protein n=1 Tax=Streptomyces althioticus TaxID=83380 RepID=UPI00369628BD